MTQVNQQMIEYTAYQRAAIPWIDNSHAEHQMLMVNEPVISVI